MSDLNYTTSGLFTSFVPNTKDGENLYKEFLEQNEGSHRIFTKHLKLTLSRMRRAGYKVTKAKKSNTTIDDILDSDLLKELGI